MLSIKRKLRSKNGASMLLAMVFMMFSLTIGGSVLASATANGSRIKAMTAEQQAYYSQRSAMFLMSDMLSYEKNGVKKELQVTIRDVTEQTGNTVTRKVFFSAPCIPEVTGGTTPNVPFLQKLLFDVVAAPYLADENATVDNSCFFWQKQENYALESAQGTITIADNVNEETLSASYTIATTDDYSMQIDFGADTSHVVLKLDGSIGQSQSTVTLDNTTTKSVTTVIHWSLPEIQKGQIVTTGGN